MPCKNSPGFFHLVLTTVIWCLLAGAAGAQGGPWRDIETRHTIIRYRNLDALESFNDNVDYSPGFSGLKGLFSISGSEDLPGSVTKKIDALYERVQEILDMRKRMQKVIIKVCPDGECLDRLYHNIQGRKRRIRAWYIFEVNTIYVNAQDVHDGLLAHEIAHSIIDHYLAVRPPRATAEILARYVDTHLYD